MLAIELAYVNSPQILTGKL